jgi:uncharacterized protein YidB (DUF937 family)
MGILDDLLGQLSAGAAPSRTAAARDDSSGAGMGQVMTALLPVVLAMLAKRQSGSQANASAGGMGGGLGSVLGQIFGRSSAGTGSGLDSLLEQFQRAGFGNEAQSWVGTGRNEPMPPNALESVFGRDGMAEIARHAGVSEQDASRGLSELMPEVIDRVTPDGRAPDENSLVASVDALIKRLGT